MRMLAGVLVVVGLATAAAYYFLAAREAPRPFVGEEPVGEDAIAEHSPEVEVIAEGLNVPWDVAFLPDGRMLVTERGGTLLLLDGGSRKELSVLPARAHARGESGLLGLALHPAFARNGFVYLYVTEERGGRSVNSVWKYRFENDELRDGEPVIEGIPGAAYHDGGRIEFGPDGFLYVATGDAGSGANAQDLASLAGKILRVTDAGEAPRDNPFADGHAAGARPEVWSYGHRNPQGLAWDGSGELWATEHGRSGLQSGYDEINRIDRANNYGWPESEGDTVRQGTVGPARHSGASTTWAPASAAIIGNRLFFGGLRGEALYEAVLEDGQVTEVREHVKGEFGRVRSVRVGPDGMLYLTTSNRDGRGSPEAGDDKLIRIHPDKL